MGLRAKTKMSHLGSKSKKMLNKNRRCRKEELKGNRNKQNLETKKNKQIIKKNNCLPAIYFQLSFVVSLTCTALPDSAKKIPPNNTNVYSIVNVSVNITD